MPSVDVHVLCFNERDILPYTLRHYATFCDRMIVHDGLSTDGSREIAKGFGAEVVDFKTDGVNDMLFKQLKENCWRGTKADWAITVDADELIYFPEGAFHTLEAYESNREAIIKPRGYEMLSEVFPTTEGQIYSEVTHGAPELKWYSKPVLFAPKRIRKLIFSAGCHTAWVDTIDGRKISDPQVPSDPPTFLLHCHHLGPLERVGQRYAGQQSRHSQTNIKNNWGNFEDPHKHARDKRAAISARLEQVIQ